MREGREGICSSQLDLFAWRERDDNSAETVGHGGWPRDALQPSRAEPENVAAITPEALHSALDSRFDDPTGKAVISCPSSLRWSDAAKRQPLHYWCACVAATPASIDRAPCLKWSPR